MNCAEAEVYVSVLYDGEPIPPNAAQHITGCESCRQTLNDYSRMGAELRLAATLEPAPLPPMRLSSPRWFDFLWRRVAIPRFALAALIACLVLATGAVSIVSAQSKPLWFQFGWGLNKASDIFHYNVAKQGYDNSSATIGFSNGVPMAVAIRIKVDDISENDVVLRCRAVPARIKVTGESVKLLGGPERGISLAAAPKIHYKPGETLPIPIQGGSGTIYLKGEVFDHQPKIAFGLPLEPPAGKMVVRSPILIGPGGQLLGDMNGAMAVAGPQPVYFGTNSNGSYLFALHPFTGAVQGEANWGEITFKLDGEKYRLVAAAPITSGDQPRPVWVRHDPRPVTESLGGAPIPK